MNEFFDIRYGVAGNVATLTLNKPAKLNALSWRSWAEIETVIGLVNESDDVKVLVITGEGRGFCSGSDLTASPDSEGQISRPGKGRMSRVRSRELVTADIYNCSKPTIAAVNGVAAGGGLSIALACDIRIASDIASFCAVFVRRAIVADTGSTWYLPRIVGIARAMEMVYTGRMVSAADALTMGLVNEVVPAETLLDRVIELARSIAVGPSYVIELDKRLIRESLERKLEDHIQMEQLLRNSVQDTEDAEEGRRAFRERRPPVFKGR